MPSQKRSKAAAAAVAGLVLLAALAGCTGAPVADTTDTPPGTTSGTTPDTTTPGSTAHGSTTPDSTTPDSGPAITGPPARPGVLNETTVAAYVEAFEEARRHDATVRHARNSSYTLRWVSVGARARVVGRTTDGGFLVESASGGGAGYQDASGRNVTSDWGLPTRSLYLVTANATATDPSGEPGQTAADPSGEPSQTVRRVALPQNWSTDTGRVVLVNFADTAVHANFEWGTKQVPTMTMTVVDAGNASTLGAVNASATPKNATVAVSGQEFTPTVRVGERGTWTETSVFVVVLPDGNVTVTRGYVVF